jgi:predicted porin
LKLRRAVFAGAWLAWFGLASAPGGASAQSDVVAYGVLDIAFESVRVGGQGTGSGTYSRVSSGTVYGSRFGLRGGETLGGGWRASFQLEAGVLADTGQSGQGGRLFGRQALVAVDSAAFGIKLGREYSPMAWMVASTTVEAFGTSDLQATIVGINDLSLRQDNSANARASLGPVSFNASWSPNAGVAPAGVGRTVNGAAPPAGVLPVTIPPSSSEGGDPGERGQSLGASLVYAPAAGWYLAAGWNRNAFGVPLYWGSVSTGVADTIQSWLVAGRMPIGAGTLTAQWWEQSLNYARGPLAGSTPRFRILGLGARYPVTERLELVGQYAYYTDRGMTGGSDTAFNVGATYALSRRAGVYFRYVQFADEAGTPAMNGLIRGGPVVTSVNLGLATVPPLGATLLAGETSSMYAVGLYHRF